MNERLSTVAQALTWATDQLRNSSDTPRLDAELLLAHILDWSRPRVLAERRTRLLQSQQIALRALVARRAALEPIAYLIGRKEFYGLDFLVDRHVLIPRPETELLVERAIAVAIRMTSDQGSTENRELRTEPEQATLTSLSRETSLVVADIGTGSGCIAIALAAHVPEALVYAVDISPEALGVARRNVERHGVADRVRLIEGDLLDALPEAVNVLVSNPPYTILSEIDEGVRRHEPHLALDGGAEGLEVYRRFLAAAPAKVRPGGAVLLEIGATQGRAVTELAQRHFPQARIEVDQDLAGLDRVVVVEL